MAMIILGLVAAVLMLIVVVASLQARSQRLRREAFVRAHVFPRHLFDTVRKTYPDLDDKDMFLVARALRSFFIVHVRSASQPIGMPSRVVDEMWHAFILDTRAYGDFCRRAFGAFLHHTPAARMAPGISRDAGLRRTWRQACLEENIDPVRPTRLPLLFAIDAKLAIAGGNTYALQAPPGAEGGLGVSASSGGSCGGFACEGGGLAEGGDGGSGDGGCGGGCGGD